MRAVALLNQTFLAALNCRVRLTIQRFPTLKLQRKGDDQPAFWEFIVFWHLGLSFDLCQRQAVTRMCLEVLFRW